MKNPNRKCEGLAHLSDEEIQERLKEAMAESGIPHDDILKFYEGANPRRFRNQFRGFHACDNGNVLIRYNSRTVKGIWVFGNLVVKDLEGNNPHVHYIENDFERLKVIPDTVGIYCEWLEAYEGDMLVTYDTNDKINCTYYVLYDSDSSRFFCRADNRVVGVNEVWHDENIGNVWERRL